MSVIIIVIFLALTSLLFIATKMFMENRLKVIKNEVEKTRSTMTGSENITLSNDIKNFTTKLNYIDGVQKKYTKWSDLLADFNKLVPTGITLSSLSFDKVTTQVLINGKAVLRDNLVDFENNLKGASFLKELESPISNILKREDIDFNFTAKLNLEKK